jgi:hypothetical protein
VLLDRAEEIRKSLGYTDAPADHATGFLFHTSYLNWAAQHGAGSSNWANLRVGRPEPMRFWYRTSPNPIVPVNPFANVTVDDPQFVWADTMLVQTDMSGRLVKFIATPPEIEKPAPYAEPDWGRLLSAAGFEPNALTEATPGRSPVTFADVQRAWLGTDPGSDQAIRIEAAAYRGRPVFFQITGPWTPAPRDTHIAVGSRQTTTANVFFILVILTMAVIFARMNLKSGRADRRGAFRVASFGFAVLMLIWLFADHVQIAEEERIRFFDGISLALFVGGAMLLIYLALEPFVRRSWPMMLVGWSRVFGGRLRDAVVGRELLIGVTAGLATTAVAFSADLIPALHQGQSPMPHLPDISVLSGTRYLIRSMLGAVSAGLQQGLLSVLTFVLFREFFRRLARWFGQQGVRVEWIGTVLAIAAVLAVSVGNGAGNWATVPFAVVAAAIELWVMLRVGLVATCVMFTVSYAVNRAALTFDGSRYFASGGWFVMAAIVALAVVGFWLARADEPLVGKPKPA